MKIVRVVVSPPAVHRPPVPPGFYFWSQPMTTSMAARLLRLHMRSDAADRGPDARFVVWTDVPRGDIQRVIRRGGGVGFVPGVYAGVAALFVPRWPDTTGYANARLWRLAKPHAFRGPFSGVDT